jgi:glc operon protein GlcG
MLGLPDAERAIDAVVREATKDACPMAVVVSDSYGEPIASLRMDGAAPRVMKHALRKVFTAGYLHRGTLDLKAHLKAHDLSLDDWGDQTVTTLQGGLPVVLDGEVIGAVAVGGNSVRRDTEVAEIAVAAVLAGISA